VRRILALMVLTGMILATGCAGGPEQSAVQPAKVNEAETALTQGNTYMDRGMFPQAEAYYLGAIKAKPTDTRAYVNLGQLYVETGRLEEAERVLTAAVQINPKEARAYNELGNVYYAHRSYDSACRLYERALAIDPTCYEAHWNLVGTCFRLNREEEALNHCQRYVELAPQTESVNIERARLYLRGQRPQ